MRLIDADALIKSVDGNRFITDSIKDYVRLSVDAQPTIEPEDKCSECDAWNKYKNYSHPERKNMVEIPETGIGDLSDGYHIFNSLYEQRMILFAALVKAYKDKAWKSYRHEDGEYCFGGGWFIVGIDTPEGSYTYHYENKYWNMFACQELSRGKHWDGHTEADAETRLMSLEPERKKGKFVGTEYDGYADGNPVFYEWVCSECGCVFEDDEPTYKFCPNCGCQMEV